MKIILLTLIFFAFLQSAFLPINLVLICIICRSLILNEKSNYYLAFFSGLALSFLTGDNLGYWPLVFLIVVKICYFIAKLPISLTPVTILLWSGIIIFIVGFLNMIFIKADFDLMNKIIEIILVFPAFYLIRNWEERFITNRNIKLRV